ncbi:MAG: Tex family protein [Bryobacteraceae bacterium]|nr:Tex family protein [Bryobacteraceae bacterium]
MSLSPEILLHISKQIDVSLKSLVATIELLDEGGTVPFVARYRKEATGNLDEVQIRNVQDRLEYFRELEERRATVLQSIQEQGKLTEELRKKIAAAMEKNELEDLYLPYKPKRRTKASIARERGLEPLAGFLWAQAPGEQPLRDFAATFINPENEITSADEALEGARHIIAEMVSENAEFRKKVRQMMAEQGVVASRRIEGVEDPEQKYTSYYEFREPVTKIPSHRMLAIRRGAKEGILHFEIELEPAGPVAYLQSQVLRGEGECAGHLREAVEDSYQRLLNPSIQTEVRLELKDRSDEEAIKVFRENLENLLLSPPAGMLSVIGIDPGIRTGCKVAVVDNTGKFLEHTVIYPHEPRNDMAGAVKTLASLIARHNAQAIAIGNGTASRETAGFVGDFLKQAGLSKVFSVVVNEAGASVYSASDVARQEFPDLDLTVRGAISIARRLQDPLAELVKVDPKSIGVGQYQHDVDQRRLKQGLEATVESCVNRVGVDLNTASVPLLRHVSGLTDRTASNIVEFRNQHGRFRNRQQLLEVAGLGPKTFQLAAGFLRIRGGDNPLDITAVHPESYPIVSRIAESLKVSVEELISKPQLVENVDIQAFRTEEAGTYTLSDIKEELRKPGRDPRDTFQLPSFRDDVKDLADLQPGMQLEGVVTNVTRFGAFVDVGVHQDGLVHVSELSNRFIKDPSEVVKAGQIVKVRVLSVDPKTKRIALSMKTEAAAKRPEPKKQEATKPAVKRASLEEQLAALNTRFRTR